MFVLIDPVNPQSHYIIYRRAESNCVCDIARACFIACRRFLETRMFKSHVLNHISSTLPGLGFIQQFLFSINHTDARRSEYLCPEKQTSRNPTVVRRRAYAIPIVHRPTILLRLLPLAISMICLAGVTVPTAFDTCANETSLVLGFRSFAYSSINNSPASFTGITRSFNPFLFANCCQGTILA